MKFLTNRPAVLLEKEKTLVVADLHIGIEHEFRKSGISIPSQTEKMRKRIEMLSRETKAKKLVILGDVKHKVPGISWQELREIPEFLNKLDKKIPLEIVPGNHDSSLKNLVPSIKFHPARGILLGKTYLAHGHTWPSPDFLRADFVLTAHRHPLFEFRDSLGYRWSEPVWIKTVLKKSIIRKKFPDAKTGRLPGIVIMPAFNPFAGGISVNSKNPGKSEKRYTGPMIKSADMKKARLYLLDGTFLGTG